MGLATEYFLKNIELKKNIKIPICFIKSKYLKKLNMYIKNRKIYALSDFYKNYPKHINLGIFEDIKKIIPEKIDVLSDDNKLISEIISLKKYDVNFFFSLVGNLYYINSLIVDINKIKNNKYFTKTIEISLLLFIYNNIVENLNKYISEFVKYKIESEKKSNKIFKTYLKKFKDGSYPELGRTLNVLLNLNIISDSKESIFYKCKFLRNKIAHANFFYDKQKRRILINQDDYSIKQFKIEFNQIQNFLLKLIKEYNLNNDNVLHKSDTLLFSISNYFRKIGRSGVDKDKFLNCVFDWEKN